MEQEQPKDYIELTDHQLRILAKEVVDGKVFTSGMIENENDLPKVFMSLIAITDEQIKWLQDNDIVMFYEYIEDAIKGSNINGCPVFSSLRSLNRKQADKLIEMCSQYYDIQKMWVGEPKE